jgi:uncharacterized metal-binding protein YceD (DUF177 family)
MPIVFNVRQAQNQDVILRDQLPGEELDLEGCDECVSLASPVSYDLVVQAMEDSFLVQGRLAIVLRCACVHCLKEFERPLEWKDWICHLELTGEEAVAVVNDCVDLTPYIREDILLSFPQHPLCEPGCTALPKTSTGGVQQTNGPSASMAASPVWAELNKLKLK